MNATPADLPRLRNAANRAERLWKQASQALARAERDAKPAVLATLDQHREQVAQLAAAAEAARHTFEQAQQHEGAASPASTVPSAAAPSPETAPETNTAPVDLTRLRNAANRAERLSKQASLALARAERDANPAVLATLDQHREQVAQLAAAAEAARHAFEQAQQPEGAASPAATVPSAAAPSLETAPETNTAPADLTRLRNAANRAERLWKQASQAQARAERDAKPAVLATLDQHREQVAQLAAAAEAARHAFEQAQQHENSVSRASTAPSAAQSSPTAIPQTNAAPADAPASSSATSSNPATTSEPPVTTPTEPNHALTDAPTATPAPPELSDSALAALSLAQLKQHFHQAQEHCRRLRQARPRDDAGRAEWSAELTAWQHQRARLKEVIGQRIEAAKAALEAAEGVSLSTLKRHAADAALALAHHRRARETDATLDADGRHEAVLHQALAEASQRIRTAMAAQGLRDAD